MDGTVTAEGLTKFLRGREGSLNEITTSAFKLLHGELDVFLPNKRIFLIRLLVDRLNDTSHSKEWKYDLNVWKLFITLWHEMDDESEIRKKETKSLRLIDIMINVICFCRSRDNLELLKTIFEFVKLVLRDSFTRVEESHAVPILASYAHTVSILFSVDDIQETLLDSWTETVKTLYDLSRANSVKLSKKNTNIFFEEALPYILKFSEKASAKNFLYSKDILLECATMFLSNKEQAFTLPSSIGLLLEKYSEILSDGAVKLLFNLVLGIPSVNMDICERIYLCISEKRNSNALSESLLGELSKHNKIISHGFFKKIYDTEFITKKETHNWNLIFEIIKMDPELALEILHDVMLKLEHADERTALILGDAIAESYLKCREFQSFYVDVLSKAGMNNSLWSSFEYVDSLSKKIAFLRPAQVIGLLNAISPRSDCLHLVKSIIKGLLYCSVTSRNLVWPYISQNEELLRPVDLDWELIYYLLCLYSKQLFESKRDYLQWIVINKVGFSRYCFYCVFRVNEILRDEMPDSRYKEDFVEFVKRIDSIEGAVVSMDLLSRWPILLESEFSKFQKKEILIMILKFSDNKKLLDYFENDSEVFFEQENLTTIFLKLLVENISIVDELKKETYLKIFCAVPVQSVSKSLKLESLDKFGELAALSKSTTIKYLSRVIMLNFLALPSFSSRIENDPRKQLELLYTSDRGSRAVSIEVLKMVLKNAITQHKSEQNRKYLLNLIHTLIEEIKTDGGTSSVKLTNAIEFSLLFLTAEKRSDLTSEFNDKLLTLEKVTIVSVFSYLNDLLSAQKDLEPTTLNKYLRFLIILLTKEKDRVQCLQMIKNMGAQVSLYDSLTNEDTLLLLFELMTKFSDRNFENAIYLSALSLALQQKYLLSTSRLGESLYHYFVHLSELPDDYTKLGLYILSSLIEIPSSNGVASVLNIISSFLKSFTKKIKDKCIILSTKLFSSILDKFKLIQFGGYDSLSCLTEMLKYFVTNMQWCCKQYNIELILLIATEIVKAIDVSFPIPSQINLYVQVSQCLSSIILFQRFRLSSRYHIINHIFVTMLKPLSSKGNALQTSAEAAAAYSRLLSNLCEPPNTTLMNQHEKLSSPASLIRKPLRNYIPVLLANFVFYNLNLNFRSEVHDILMEGVFSIFDILSQREINYVNDILDNQGKAYYKTLYKSYKDFGKWNSQETF